MARRGNGVKPEILQGLLRVSLDTQEHIGELQSEVSEDRKAAVREHGLHAGAFALCVRLAKMDQVKRLAFLNAFDAYREPLNLDDAPQTEAFEQRERAA